MKRIQMLVVGAVVSVFAGCVAGTDESGEAVDSNQEGLRCLTCDGDTVDPTGGGTTSGGTTSGGTTSSSSSSSSGSTYTPPSPVNALPQGLTGGLAYINHQCGLSLSGITNVASSVGSFFVACLSSVDSTCVTNGAGVIKSFVDLSSSWCSNPTVNLAGAVAGVPTLAMTSTSEFKVSGAPGWAVGSDGDRGNNAAFGFYHQELTAAGGGLTDTSKSSLLALPPGTVCGFHHTQNTPANAYAMGTCMGMDPGAGVCPSGWRARSHFDMSSGDGQADCSNLANLTSPHCGYFVWCEYQDPNNFCPNGSTCETNAVNAGYAIGVASDVYPNGNDIYGTSCPAGSYRSPWYDDGMSAGQGVGACVH